MVQSPTSKEDVGRPVWPLDLIAKRPDYMKKAVVAIIAALTLGSGIAFAEGLTAQDFQYLQSAHGVTQQSAVIVELTPNEQQALHSAIDDLKTYPEGRDRQVRRYLWLVYGRECRRWAIGHSGQNCSPAADPAT